MFILLALVSSSMQTKGNVFGLKMPAYLGEKSEGTGFFRASAFYALVFGVFTDKL